MSTSSTRGEKILFSEEKVIKVYRTQFNIRINSVVAKPHQGLKQSLRDEHERRLSGAVIICTQRDEQAQNVLEAWPLARRQETAASLRSSQRHDVAKALQSLLTKTWVASHLDLIVAHGTWLIPFGKPCHRVT